MTGPAELYNVAQTTTTVIDDPLNLSVVSKSFAGSVIASSAETFNVSVRVMSGSTGEGGAAETATKYSQILIGGSTTEVVTHDLDTTDVDVHVYEISTGNEVIVENSRTSDNTVTLTFVTAPAANTYDVVIMG